MRKQSSAQYIIYNAIVLLLLSAVFRNTSIFALGILGSLILLSFTKDLDAEMFRLLYIAMTISFIWLILQYAGLTDVFDKPYFGADDETFEYYGGELYKANAYTISDCPSYGYEIDKCIGFMLIMSWIMRISSIFGGYHTLTPRLINIYMWLSVGIMVYKYIRSSNPKTNHKVLRTVVLGLMLFPNAMFINSCVYRDTLSIFLMYLCVYFTKKISIGNLKKNIMQFISTGIVYVISIYILYYVRKDLLIALFPLIGFQIFWDGCSPKIRMIKRLLFIGLGLAIGGPYAFERVNRMLLGYNNYILYKTDAINKISGIVFTTPILPFGIFLRFITGLLQPFPGGIITLDFAGSFLYGFVQIVVRLGTILQLCCLPYVFKSVLKFDSDSMKFLLVFMMIIITTFGFRHFIMVYPFMAAELYYGAKNLSKAKIKSISIIILSACCLAGVVYIFLLRL